MPSSSQVFEECWNSFRDLYKKHSRFKASGYDIKRTKGTFKKHWIRIWKEKHIFTERDITLFLSKCCMGKLGDGWVHTELPIGKMFFENYDIEVDRRRNYIDIALINPQKFKNGIELRKTPWDIFAEVKFISAGMFGGKYGVDRTIEGAIKDCKKLQNQVKKNRCEKGYVCIVNDLGKERDLRNDSRKWSDDKRVKVLLCQIKLERG